MPEGPPAKAVKETLSVKTFRTADAVAEALAPRGASKGAPKATQSDLSKGPPPKGAPTIADAVAAALPPKILRQNPPRQEYQLQGALLSLMSLLMRWRLD